MHPTMSSTKLTYDDYCLIPDDGKRHEIIDGGHYVSPAPSFYHQQIVIALLTRLHGFVSQHELGTVSVAPVDILFSDVNVVQPDILFIASDREQIITKRNVQGAPDLLIEVLSESNRRHDEIVKRKLYEQFGVREYWIVDPELETVKVYRLKDGAYGKPMLLSRENDETLESPLLPGFRCGLDDVFVGR